MNQEISMEEPGNTWIRPSPGKAGLALCIPWLFYSPFCLDTANSISSDFQTVSSLPSLCNSLHVCASASSKQGTKARQTCLVPQAGEDRDREINRAVCWLQDPLLSCSLISLPRTNSPSLSITVPFLPGVRHYSGTAPTGAEPTGSGSGKRDPAQQQHWKGLRH